MAISLSPVGERFLAMQTTSITSATSTNVVVETCNRQALVRHISPSKTLGHDLLGGVPNTFTECQKHSFGTFEKLSRTTDGQQAGIDDSTDDEELSQKERIDDVRTAIEEMAPVSTGALAAALSDDYSSDKI